MRTHDHGFSETLTEILMHIDHRQAFLKLNLYAARNRRITASFPFSSIGTRTIFPVPRLVICAPVTFRFRLRLFLKDRLKPSARVK